MLSPLSLTDFGFIIIEMHQTLTFHCEGRFWEGYDFCKAQNFASAHKFSIVRFDGDTERAKKVYEGLQPLTPDDIAETIYWMASRPAHVNINDVIIMPTAQANSTTVNRKN